MLILTARSFLNIPGSAAPEKKCELVKTKIKFPCSLSIGSEVIHFQCTTKDRIKQCEGNCTYCEHGCQAVKSRTIKRTSDCILETPDPYVITQKIQTRKEIEEHEECGCVNIKPESKKSPKQ